MAVGASAQYAHFFPQKTNKQMNFINQNTSKVDFWAGNGQEKLSFLTIEPEGIPPFPTRKLKKGKEEVQPQHHFRKQQMNNENYLPLNLIHTKD